MRGKTATEIWFGPAGQFKSTGTSGANVGSFTIQDIGLTNQGGGAVFGLSLNYTERVSIERCIIYGTGVVLSAFNYITMRDCDLFGGELYADHPTANGISEALKMFGCNGSGFKITVRDTADVMIDNVSLLGGQSQINIQRGDQPANFWPPIFISNTVVDSSDSEALILDGVAPKVSSSFFSGGRTNLKDGYLYI